MRRPAYPLVALLVLVLLSAARPVAAQEAGGPVPRIEDAESAFQQGLQAFQEADYGMAYRRFRVVYAMLPLNRKTTAAQLMAGKALYRSGDYAEAVDLLSGFIRTYPTSGYLDEANRTLELARQALQGGAAARPRVTDLGIVLPLREEDAALTQALFNGIRIAVDEHNARAGAAPVRMVFRDSRGQAARAREAVASLAAGEGVQAIVGPLFSAEASAAAAAAEAAGVVLVAPLATDEGVSQGRRYVFQANPTITMRGRQMARFALNNLRMRRFGIVAERDDARISERMAAGFQDEVREQGGTVVFSKMLENERGWANLQAELGGGALSSVEGLYLPVAGGNAAQHARAALDGLDLLNANVRVLGNSEWHDLSARTRASKYLATYTLDFHVDEQSPAVRTFDQRYRSLTGKAPQGQERRLAYTGYDVARFLLQHLGRTQGGQPLYEALQRAPRYDGLGIRIHFAGGNVNEALSFLRYRAGAIERLR